MSGIGPCVCGHEFGAHLEDEEDDSEGSICGEPGCPCEGFRAGFLEEPAELTGAPVVGLESRPDPKIIDTLESMLADAKSGKMRGFAAVSFEAGGDSRQWEAGRFASAAALWAFEHMKHRLLFGGR